MFPHAGIAGMRPIHIKDSDLLLPPRKYPVFLTDGTTFKASSLVLPTG